MRLRTFLLPVVVVAAVIGGWSAVWSWGAHRAEDAVQRWQAAEAANGRVIQCAERTRGGYPFRMELTCTRPVVELRDEARPYQTFRFEKLKVVSQIWSPGHVISEWTGPMTVVTEGDPSVTTATWRLAQASAQLTGTTLFPNGFGQLDAQGTANAALAFPAAAPLPGALLGMSVHACTWLFPAAGAPAGEPSNPVEIRFVP